MDKPIVLAFGRLNPPTKGHQKLVDTMVSAAKKYNAPAQLYLSHSTDKLRNPLTYDSKLYWVDKAFGSKVDVVKSEERTVFEILKRLSNEGYTDVIYVGGGDRIGGEGDISQQILRYNGTPGKNGEIPYSFNSIKFVNAGNRNDSSDDIIERASASAARAAVVNGNFEGFKELVPFNEKDADNLFRQLYVTMVDGELPENLYRIPPRDDLFNEALVYGDNDNEFFSEEDRCLFEDINVGNTTISKIKNSIKHKFISELDSIPSDGTLTLGNSDRHPFEIIRIGNDASSGSTLTEEDLKKIVSKAYNKMDKHFENFTLDNTLGDYSLHPGDKASGTFNSFAVNGQTDGGNPFTVYITVKSGRNANKKLFTPNKVLNLPIWPVSKNELRINNAFTKNSDLKKLLEMLISEASEDKNIKISARALNRGVEYLTGKTKSPPSDIELTFKCPKSSKIFNYLNDSYKGSIASTIYTDFTEVIGAVCLSTALGEDSKIEFPTSSTEKLIDYIVYDSNGNKIKVSAKHGAGGKPSSTGLIEMVSANPLTPDNVKSFVDWFISNHIKSRATQGHLNVANKMVDILIGNTNMDSSWEKELPMIPNGREIVDQYNLARGGDGKALEKLKVLINNNLGNLTGKNISYIDNLYPRGTNKDLLELESFIPNKAIFCMCKLFVNLINSSNLIKELNQSFSNLFGKFIQAYCINPNLDLGEFTFKLVFTSDGDIGHNYIFVEDCANNIPDGRMIIKKIALQLV